ncbi:DUF6350 family protein [Schaalia sp. Marseille-Q2122]|uniref:cell division protein PerM n=1 Tax=Schaalia sp. Marseille-Q2122 TaxID=2736604 RepID=UPI00158A5B8B|nr:DUF6350 family protein [Schaalia sp. Marseille-Q2122]
MSETPTPSTPSRGEALNGQSSRGSAMPGDSVTASARSDARSMDASASTSAEASRHMVTPVRGISTPTHGVGSRAQAGATPTDSEAAPGRQSATPPVASSDEQRPRAARSERKTLRIRIPDGWGRSLLAGVEGALLGWALSTTLVLVTYLGVSGNPWMGKISWDDAMAVGSDLWAMSLGSPLTVNEVTYRAVPLLMTLLAVVILRLLLFTGRHFPASALWFAVPAYMGTTALLVGSNTTHHSWPATMIGAFCCATLATAWAALGQTRAAYRKACTLAREADTAPPEPPRMMQIPEWLRIGLRQGAAMTGIVGVASLIALMSLVFVRWENVVAIADLLHPATTVDTVMLAIAQALFVPTAGAWVAAWGAGPGVVLGPDTVHSLTSAPTAPIPPVPFLGVLPSSPVGAWVVCVPLVLGALVGVLFAWRGRLPSLREQAYALGVAAGVFALFMAAWMWLSILTLGQGRMVGIGPRLEWTLPALLGEILGAVALIVVLSHPITRAWMQGCRADAHEALAGSSLGQKIRAGRAAHEGVAEAGPGEGASSGMAEGSTGLEARASRTEDLDPDDIPTEVFSVAEGADSVQPELVEVSESSEGDAATSQTTETDAVTTETTAPLSEVIALAEDVTDDPAINEAASDVDARGSAQNPSIEAADTGSVDTGSLYATTRRPRPATEADTIPTTRIPRIEDPADD